MTIKIILTLGLLFVLLYGLAQRVTAKILTLVFSFIVVLGLYFVWVPDHTQVIAELLGVGRGVDLMMYCWILITLFVGLNLHLKVRENLRLITQLARRAALAAAKGHSNDATDS